MRFARVLSSASLVALFLAVTCLAPPARAADKKAEFFAAFSLNDARHSEYRAMQGSFSAEFPLAKYLSIGPVFQYNYLRQQITDTTTTVTPPTDKWASSPDPGVTHSSTHGDTAEVWSIGGRAVLHLTPGHNGVYFAAETVVPQKDADGYVVTPEAGFQFMLGRAIGRVAYRHPFQQNGGDTVDLEGDAVTFAFGASF